MPSPFPGMNPYLEQDDAWHDFHESFLPLARDLLVPQIRPNFIAKLDQHVYIHEPSAQERLRLGRSDVSVAEERSVPVAASARLFSAPGHGRIDLTVDFEKQAFLEIRDRHDRSLITVIELLSPVNKTTGPDREQFVAKRLQYLRSAAHYVEIDLLRSRPRLPIEGLPECAYYVMVSRVEDRPNVELWPLTLRERLPVIPVPLRAPKSDAVLDLQEMVHRIYDAAGFEDYIYESLPEPRLRPPDDAWVKQFLPQKS